ncbi:response regulator [Pseudooceanicola sp. CBS1P-1]|uniref:Response regulator n=1 Tax=Pseudooceanicola albus TaxID=2692189 RepID=A0A6L7G697_9RHOB|nr:MULTISPECIES: response regulator [Pseudooceanicola]MBT9383014.1 response regulator [Pseudooceanicola endophyticus]MXN19202.1 response regulator [Pseudooceanicola albus]
MARILIADDDPDYVAVFTDGLEALGHDVDSVSSGQEVLPLLRQKSFDVIFLDVVMSGGGAISVLHQIRAEFSDLPVVIITGRPELIDSPLFVSGLRLAQARMHKTATLRQLDEVVRTLTPA